MKIYIAGKVRGLKNYREVFKAAENKLQSKGHIALNPAELPEGLDGKDYMPICLSMLEISDAIYMLSNWVDSEGAPIELAYAKCQGKKVFYEEEDK